MSTKVPLKRTLSVVIAADATDAESTTILGRAPFIGEITGVSFIPNAAITGAATDNRKIAIVNKGAAGVGTTEAAGLTFAAGVNGVAFDEKAVTLSAVTGATDVAVGDVLAVASTAPGTGLANPGGQIIVEITRS